jgi:glycosyltransferase involved in cell wall biosynthesis
LHCTDVRAYPPVLNASALMADHDWEVTVLSSPTAEISGLGVAEHPGVNHLATRMRNGYAFRTGDFLAYLVRATDLALRLQPQLIYASNPLSCLPALAASAVSGAKVLYHEHDSPSPGDLRPLVAGWRAALARQARLVVTPNCERGRHLQDEIKFPAQRLRTVWNVPRRGELPALPATTAGPLVLHYHGSIAPAMLPRTVVEAVQLLGGRVRLRITGYEASSGRGYVKQLVDLGLGSDGSSLVEYAGQVPRADLLAKASQAHVGLALAPPSSENINLRHLVGASNKAFDYMAAGLALLVSDLGDWREMFVKPGFALPCDPADPASIAAALDWFVAHDAERAAMAQRARAKIEADWNYETAFAPILQSLSPE